MRNSIPWFTFLSLLVCGSQVTSFIKAATHTKSPFHHTHSVHNIYRHHTTPLICGSVWRDADPPMQQRSDGRQPTADRQSTVRPSDMQNARWMQGEKCFPRSRHHDWRPQLGKHERFATFVPTNAPAKYTPRYVYATEIALRHVTYTQRRRLRG